jgi:hypothetical protein
VAKAKTKQALALPGDSSWLTLKEAAELCGLRPAELREQIERGRVRAFTVQQGKKTSFRLLRSTLADAGLLREQRPKPDPEPDTARVDLLSLIRDQNQRISSLEDQRAHLAGQLGVALERLRSIDERLTDLETLPESINLYRAIESEAKNGKGEHGLRKSFRKVVELSPAPKKWKRDQ